jgi:hypothetical protein
MLAMSSMARQPHPSIVSHDILSDMTPEQLRAYAQRAWHVAEALEQDHWARERADRGPRATFEASQALWEHMRAVRPDWPSDDERRQDLADHIALKRLIDRAAGAFLTVSPR